MLDTRIKAFITLGNKIKEALSRAEGEYEGLSKEQINLLVTIKQAGFKNGWFTEKSVRKALNGICEILNESDVLEFTSKYVDELSKLKGGKEVGVIMAGNIPAVGFHDFLCVLLSGNTVVTKMSSDDEVLIPAIAQLLISIEASFKDKIIISSVPRSEYDAVIATGSNNSARYFEQYFGKFPNIIRKSRTSIAIITGDETPEELVGLGKDIFTYFGLGCRNVSKLYLVGDVDIVWLIDALVKEATDLDLSKYQNNVDYYRSVYLLNKVKFLEAKDFLFKEDEGLSSPLSVTFFEKVDSVSKVEAFIADNKEEIQCVIGSGIKNGLAFGEAQNPKIWDYADNVDTMEFLIGLEK
tara:strand:+ start:662 stop:1720 length:1059 start_codon:yes stop_codon:yes gene_type:complete